MQYQIRMTPEVEKLLARLNAQVHTAWYGSGATGAPRRLLGQIGFWIAGPGLDAAYQRQLMALTRARRAVADVATSRKRLELQIGGLERRADEFLEPGSETTDTGQVGAAEQARAARDLAGQLADLRRQYADAQAKEERVSAASRRLAAEVDAFRAGKEAAKAAYTAAEEAAKAVRDQAADDLVRDGATGEEPRSG